MQGCNFLPHVWYFIICCVAGFAKTTVESVSDNITNEDETLWTLFSENKSVGFIMALRQWAYREHKRANGETIIDINKYNLDRNTDYLVIDAMHQTNDRFLVYIV